MINLRYHIASLAAVLAALGIGVLIGGVMINDSLVLREQERLVLRLEQDFNALREQNRLSQQEIAVFKNTSGNLEVFVGQVLPVLVEGRLAGVKLTVICLNETGLPAGLLDVLNLAGADVDLYFSLTNIDFNNQTQMDRIRQALNLKPRAGAGPVGRRLAEVLANGAELAKLADAGIIRVEKRGEINGTVLVVGGSSLPGANRMSSLDLPLLKNLVQAGRTVVAVETSDAAQSGINLYKKAVAATVDNVDTIPGQVAMVWVLAGQTGHYGAKATAYQLLPTIKE